MEKWRYTLWVEDEDGQHIEWEIPDAVVEGLRVNYRAISVHDQLMMMHVWTYCNPAQRWKKASAMKAVNRWLKKALEAAPKTRRASQRSLDLAPAPRPAAGPRSAPPPEVAELVKRLRAGKVAAP